ncbi:PhnA protein-like protein [Psychromonas sp. CNPT3]|uniref:PhnA domain-containing protein n=1 Tax=Psychromonas sp. CNPT3 TaxID=314282 RepID=UPI00006E85D4|nr:PhnA domain-containing protein [Psychromonas sp. CNPT3]AGH81424.1 PhnA protein-like protein [Psychromonas sp. CNPT3]
MPILAALNERNSASCELCSATKNLAVFEVPPVKEPNSDKSVLVCETCATQLNKEVEMDSDHWRCLNDSMWSQVPAVQVTAFRLLTRLSKTEIWAQDLLDMMYLEDETRAWADYGVAADDIEEVAPTRDSNGSILLAGDNVTLIKDLDVKGGNFTAKRGTPVRNISLTDNPEHIEGRVNGVRIVLLTCYLKKMPLFDA